MTQPQPPTPLPMINASYAGSGCSFVIDKTGTTFQVTVCSTTPGGPWGPHVVRTVKGGPAQVCGLFLVPLAVWSFSTSNFFLAM